LVLTDEQKEIQRKLIELCHTTLAPNPIESDRDSIFPSHGQFRNGECAAMARLFDLADTAPSEITLLGAFQALRHKFCHIQIHDG